MRINRIEDRMDDNSSLGHQNGGGSAVGQLGGIGGGAGGGQGGGTGGLGDMSGGGGAGSGLVGKGGAGGGGGMVGAGQCDDQNNKTPTQYSIPGILHFIQHEWARFELERSQWDVDRAELQVRRGFLRNGIEGEILVGNWCSRTFKLASYVGSKNESKLNCPATLMGNQLAE